MYDATFLVPFQRVTLTLPVASTGTSIVMLTLLPLVIIPLSDTVKLMPEATLLTLITSVLLMHERYWSSPR